MFMGEFHHSVEPEYTAEYDKIIELFSTGGEE